jgi:hemin uptake protein HemP
MSEKSNTPTPAPGPGVAPRTRGEKVVESRDLLDGHNEVVILHEGRLYRLRRTRLGKLILTA